MKRAVLVKSCRQFRNRQAACLSTWASDISRHDIPVWFVEGKGSNNWSGSRIMVDVKDDYRSLPMKVRAAFKWYLKESDFEMIFLCDDDTFVQVPRWISHEPAGEMECRLFRPTNEGGLRLNGGQPWATGGAGVWLSRRLVELYTIRVSDNQLHDDVIASKIAQQSGIEITDRPDLYGADGYTNSKDRVGKDNQFITSHHIQPDEMRRLYESTTAIT